MFPWSLFGTIGAKSAKALKDDYTRGRQVDSDGNIVVSSDPAESGNITYDALYAMNPYRNYTYRSSWFQDLLGGLGFRTDADRYREEMAMNAREYDANIALKEYNENFENPVNEAQRLRNAGINPALSGLGDANQASPISPDENPPSAMESDMNTIQGFASTMMNLYQLTMGFASDLQSLKSLQLANESGDIDNIGKMLGLANDLVLQSTSDQVDENGTVGNNRFTQTYVDSIGAGLMSKRSRKRFADASVTAIGNLSNSSRIAELRNKRSKDRFEFAQMFKSDYYDEVDAFLYDFIEPIAKLNDNLLRYKKKREVSDIERTISDNETTISSNEKVQEYNENYNAKLAADAANATNAEVSQSSMFQSEVNGAFRDAIHKLSEDAKRGNRLSSIGLFLAQLLQSQFLANSSASKSVIGPR